MFRLIGLLRGIIVYITLKIIIKTIIWIRIGLSFHICFIKEDKRFVGHWEQVVKLLIYLVLFFYVHDITWTEKTIINVVDGRPPYKWATKSEFLFSVLNKNIKTYTGILPSLCGTHGLMHKFHSKIGVIIYSNECVTLHTTKFLE